MLNRTLALQEQLYEGGARLLAWSVTAPHSLTGLFSSLTSASFGFFSSLASSGAGAIPPGAPGLQLFLSISPLASMRTSKGHLLSAPVVGRSNELEVNGLAYQFFDGCLDAHLLQLDHPRGPDERRP